MAPAKCTPQGCTENNILSGIIVTCLLGVAIAALCIYFFFRHHDFKIFGSHTKNKSPWWSQGAALKTLEETVVLSPGRQVPGWEELYGRCATNSIPPYGPPSLHPNSRPLKPIPCCLLVGDRQLSHMDSVAPWALPPARPGGSTRTQPMTLPQGRVSQGRLYPHHSLSNCKWDTVTLRGSSRRAASMTDHT